MNKAALGSIIVILVIIILGGGGFFLLGKSHTYAPSQTANNVTQKQPEPTVSTVSGMKSLRDLMTLHTSQQCTFNDTQRGSSGTVLTSNGKMRGDFQAQVSGTPTQSHVVEDGQYMYFWMDGQTKGYKMSLTAIDKISQGAAQQYQSQMMDMKKQVDYHCSAWVSDASKFTVPATVTFTDYTSMMEGVMRGGTTLPSQVMQNNAAACGACNNLPAAAQAQCKAALKCQ